MAKTLTSGAEFHKWETAPKYVGRYTGEKQIREKDATVEAGKQLEDREKAGAVLGYIFEDVEGEQTIIGGAHSVEKAMEKVQPDQWVAFEWLGKTKNSKGQQVNRFKIDLMDDEKEAATFFGE